MNERCMDLIYFGYESDSRALEHKFVSAVKENFPDVELRDAYDSIKGYRQEVWVDKDKQENFNMWLIANGWGLHSLTLQLMLMDEKLRDDFKGLLEKTKQKYPDFAEQLKKDKN